LNAITNIPCGILNFTIHPLFTYGVLNGDSIGDADFSKGKLGDIKARWRSQSNEDLGRI